MATIALDTYREIRAAESETPGLPEVLDCFAEVIEAIDSEAALDEILHLVARKVCTLVECSRCSLYLKHSDTGLYRGQVIEPSGDGADERIRRLICGTVADRVTQEVLATRAPVFVRNAQDDRRTVRSIMQMWGVRSMLGVPMIVREDVVGILYLDNEDESHPFTEQQQSVASAFAHLAGIAIQQAQRAAELRTNLQTVARQNELLRHSHRDRGEADPARARGRHPRRHRDGRLGPDRQAVRDPRRRLPAPGGRRPVRRRPPLFERARRRVPQPAGRRVGPGRAQAQPARRRRRRAGRRAHAPLPRGPGRPAREDVGLPGGHGVRIALHRARPRHLAPRGDRDRDRALGGGPRDRGRPPGPRGPGPRPPALPRGPGRARAPGGVDELPDREPAPGLPARRAGRGRPAVDRRWSSRRTRRSRPTRSRG